MAAVDQDTTHHSPAALSAWHTAVTPPHKYTLSGKEEDAATLPAGADDAHFRQPRRRAECAAALLPDCQHTHTGSHCIQNLLPASKTSPLWGQGSDLTTAAPFRHPCSNPLAPYTRMASDCCQISIDPKRRKRDAQAHCHCCSAGALRCPAGQTGSRWCRTPASRSREDHSCYLPSLLL
jgi:hypothetical protein